MNNEKIKKEIVRELQKNWEEIKEYLINTYQSTLEDKDFESLVSGDDSLDGLQEMANIIGRLDGALNGELTDEELVEHDIVNFSELHDLLNDLSIGYINDDDDDPTVLKIKKIGEMLETFWW